MPVSMNDIRLQYRAEFSDGVSAGAERAAKGMEKLAAAFDKGGESATRAGPSFTSIERRLDTQAALTAKLDAIERKHEQTVAALTARREAGRISIERETQLIQNAAAVREQAIQRTVAATKRQTEAQEAAARALNAGVAGQTAHERAARLSTAAVNDNARAMTGGAASAGQMRASLINLGQQAQDVFVSLQGGQKPLTVLLQQGSQIATVFAATPGGVSGVLSAAGTAIGRMITPATAAAAGIAVLAGGFALLVSRAIEARGEIRQFDVLLRGMGIGSLATGAELEAMTRRLRDVGLTAAEAKTQIDTIARAGINPAAAERVVRVGQDLKPVLGDNAAQTLVSALSGPDRLESTIKLGQAINALTAAQVTNYREMARGGETARALDLAFAQIERRVKGMGDEALAPAQRAMRELRVTWSEALDSLAKTGPIQQAVDALTGLANIITRLSRGGVTDGGTGALAGAWKGFLAGMPGGPITALGAAAVGVGVGAGVGWFRSGDAPAATAPSPPLSGAVGAAAAAAEAATMVGLNANRDRSQIESYLRAGGSNLSQAEVAWCAAFANAALARQGIAGTGSNVATSFLNWGAGVTGEPSAGDVVVLPRGRAAGQVGGHVGLATGATQLTDRGLLLEMIAGNERNAVGRSWVTANEAVLRRAPEATGAVAAAGGAPSLANPNAAETARAAAEGYTAELQRQLAVIERVGAASDALRAIQQAEAFAAEKGIEGTDKKRLVLDAVANVYNKVTAEINKSIGASESEITSTRRITEALNQGAAAGARAEAQMKAETEAMRLFGETSSDAAKKYISSRASQDLVAKEFAQAQKFARDTIQDRGTIEVLQLQARLQGQTSEEINRQVALLRVKQEAEANHLPVLGAETQERLKTVNALSQANTQLIEAQRQQQRVDDLFRGIGETISSTIGNAIEGIFDPSRVQDWGKALRSVLSSVASQIAQSLLVRPLTGEILGALGASANVVGQFGGFGGGTGGQQIAVRSDGVLTLGNASSVASLANNTGIFGDLGLSSTFSGVKDFFGGGLGGLFSTPGGSALGVQELALGFTPSGLGGVGGGLIPASFGSFAGGAGAGFAAGSLLNSLVGGNQTGGMIGSGIGSLAGAAIGSFLLPGIGTLLGGILGGSGGGLLGGMFGNSRPSNASAGAGFDLASGRVTGGFAGGDQAIDSETRAAAETLAAVVSALSSIPGNTLGGELLLQHGKNTGVTLDWRGLTGVAGRPDAGRISLGNDPMAAVQQIGLGLAQGLEGVSDTVKSILNSTSDLSQLAENLQFASIYENIRTAAEGAFASVEDATKRAGPFQTAMQQIGDTFQQIDDRAAGFGLSRDPVDAARAEAERRLRADFETTFTAAERNAGGRDFLNQLDAVALQREMWGRESGALGVQTPEWNARNNGLATVQWTAILRERTSDDLKAVVDAFATLRPELAGLAGSLIVTAEAAARADFATSFAVAENSAKGSDFLNQLDAIAQQRELWGRQAGALGVQDSAFNDRNNIMTAMLWSGVLKDRTVEDLKSVTDAFGTLHPDLAALAESLKATAAATAPATAGLRELLASLTSGPLAGLTPGQAVLAQQANFDKLFNMVRAGDTSQYDALAKAGADLLAASQNAYGNAPITAATRDALLNITGTIIEGRSFASGTRATPPGLILVGERGPELMRQAGGAQIWSNRETQQMLGSVAVTGVRSFAGGTDGPPTWYRPERRFEPLMMSPAASSNTAELIQEIRALRKELADLAAGGNAIAQAGFIETIARLQALLTASMKKPLVEPKRRSA